MTKSVLHKLFLSKATNLVCDYDIHPSGQTNNSC